MCIYMEEETRSYRREKEEWEHERGVTWEKGDIGEEEDDMRLR